MAHDDAAAGLAQRKLHLYFAKKALPGPQYYDVLGWIHQTLKPATYLEIGVQNGDSLLAAAPETLCLGIDPDPTPNKPLSAKTHLFRMTSDEFFASHHLPDVLGRDHLSLAFIDGSHLFEQALLDFIHLERFTGRESMIVLHDCLPLDRATSDRTRTTDFYSGDVWKLTLCLREFRPDLRMVIVPTNPTGLCLVSGLDPASGLLARDYDACVARYLDLDFDDYQMRVLQMPPQIPNTHAAITTYLAGIMADRQSAFRA